MKIAILGAGAMGSVLAAHLTRAGEEVAVIARGNRAEDIKKNGIIIEGLENFTVSCPVITDADTLKKVDVLIYTVKTYDMEPSLKALGHVSAASVFSVQNGVLKNEQMAEVYGSEKVLGAAAFLSGELEQSGVVRFTLNQCLYVGELSGGASSRVDSIVEILNKAGIKAEASHRIMSVEWSKFISWLALMSLSVLTRLNTWKFLSVLDTARFGAQIMKEAALLAAEKGIELEDRPPFPVKSMTGMTIDESAKKLCEVGALMEAVTPDHRVSALQDLLRGKRLEAGETLGYVVARAKEENITVPAVETAFRLINGINHYLK